MNKPQDMNDKEINDYMDRLAETDGIGLEGLELHAWAKFANLTKQVDQADKSVRAAQQQVEDGRAFMQRTNGQRDAYASLLISAEGQRRYLKVEVATKTLQDAIDSGDKDVIPIAGKNKQEANDDKPTKEQPGQGSPDATRKPESAGIIPPQG